jgi:hypothetical protein
MARQGKPQSELAPVTLSQLGYAFMAYRRSVGDYHGASLGADSARAAGVIEVTYEALVQLAAKAGLPNMPPKPQARNSWHGDWSDWGLWLDSLKDWWAEAEARLSAGEERAGGLGARKNSRVQQAEMKYKLLSAIKARGSNASPTIIIREAHVNRNRALECLRQLAKEGRYNGFKRPPRSRGKTRR